MDALPRRKRTRRAGHDYSAPGSYFVTVVTRYRAHILGAISRDGVVLSDRGLIVDSIWRSIHDPARGTCLEAFVVMPDHLHALISLKADRDTRHSISDIVGWAKSRSSHAINVLSRTPGARVWQASFHDRIIRGDTDRVRRYIANNPSHAAMRFRP